MAQHLTEENKILTARVQVFEDHLKQRDSELEQKLQYNMKQTAPELTVTDVFKETEEERDINDKIAALQAKLRKTL